RLIPDHALGLPVLRTLSLCTCCRHYPGAATGRRLRSSSPSRISLPRKGRRVGLHIVLFGACSAFTRVAACTLARSPVRDPHSEGFSHFVTSMTAPVASGWSDLPGGACTHWKAPPFHGAHPERTLKPRLRQREASLVAKAPGTRWTAALSKPKKRPIIVALPQSNGSGLFSLSRAVRRLLAHRRFGVEDLGAHPHTGRPINEPRCHFGAQRICAELEKVVSYPDVVAS